MVSTDATSSGQSCTVGASTQSSAGSRRPREAEVEVRAAKRQLKLKEKNAEGEKWKEKVGQC
jgi:hypothetical protein